MYLVEWYPVDRIRFGKKMNLDFFFFLCSKEITPVQYMVALEGHDPDPNFVATPSSNDLAQPLTQAGAAPCGCNPKLAGSFQLKGTTNPNDKGKITDAIADAFAKENQGINLTLPFILHEVTITNLLFPHCQHYLQTNSNRDFEKK